MISFCFSCTAAVSARLSSRLTPDFVSGADTSSVMRIVRMFSVLSRMVTASMRGVPKVALFRTYPESLYLLVSSQLPVSRSCRVPLYLW